LTCGLAFAQAVSQICGTATDESGAVMPGVDFEPFDRSIDVHIPSLRKRLADGAKIPRLIETVRGMGYRMRVPGTEAIQ
jgi:hypothetical protein